MNLDEALELIRPIDLGQGDHAIFGSGPLLVRGIISDIGDIDIVARGQAWERALELGSLITLPEHSVSVVALYDARVTIGRSWAYGTFDINEAIDTADFILDLPWVSLDLVAAYKRAADRPKDRDHLRLLAEWTRSAGPGSQLP